MNEVITMRNKDLEQIKIVQSRALPKKQQS